MVNRQIWISYLINEVINDLSKNESREINTLLDNNVLKIFSKVLLIKKNI